jgi:hypothetical protein
MENMPLTLTVTFTPATTAAYPALKGWKAPVPPHLIGQLLIGLQKDDIVQMQGIPTTAPMTVLTRLWVLMEDQAELAVVLHAQGTPTGDTSNAA